MASEPIIDIHQHASKAMLGEDGLPVRNPITGTPSKAHTDQEMITETLNEMDKNNIIKALAGGAPEVVEKWVETAPDRFIPSIALRLNPITPTPEKVRELLENGSVKAIGEVTVQYFGLPPNDPQLDPYYRLAEEYDVPVWIHVCGGGAYGFSGFRVKHGNPILVEDVLVRYPDLRLCICHFGAPFKMEMASMLYMYPRLYADISCYNWMMPREVFYDLLKDVLDYSGKSRSVKRLMFGSDQMKWPSVISQAVETVKKAPFLTDSQKRDVLYNNAKKFLRL